ncbi:MAG: antitoxin [Clostridia bacterium]
MSDMLKVTTPVVNRNQTTTSNTKVDPTSPYSINDPSRVVRIHNNPETTDQNANFADKDGGPVLLQTLLKDPAVAVSYLKNIFMLEEIFKLIPANNQTFTEEIEKIFSNLMMESADIQSELVRQEASATAFKGELFDYLRNLLQDDDLKASTRQGIATLLRAINNLAGKKDILDAAGNSLTFMRENVHTNVDLATQIDELIAKFRADDATEHFSELKEQALGICKQVEESILFSPQLSKVVSILKYNLSRYNDNTIFFNQSASRLRQMLGSENQREFIRVLEGFVKQLRAGEFPQTPNETQTSKVMDTLIRLVDAQSQNEAINYSEGAKIDNILHSLLSSPCNFTPLLHFIVPVFYEGMKSFAEIWINPQSDEKDMVAGAKSGQHFLLVIDIETIGRFEAEVFAHDRIIDFHLYCPGGYERIFENIPSDISKSLNTLNFKLGESKVEKLREPRSLMQVFKSLPYKRVGVDVKI